MNFVIEVMMMIIINKAVKSKADVILNHTIILELFLLIFKKVVKSKTDITLTYTIILEFLFLLIFTTSLTVMSYTWCINLFCKYFRSFAYVELI